MRPPHGDTANSGSPRSISNARTFMLGPLLGTGLYEIAPAVPYLLGTVLLAGLAVFTFVHPGVRRTPDAATVGAR